MIAVTGLIGVYLVSRQWEDDLSTYQDFVSLEGIDLGASTLAGIKSAHELGHAYVAVNYGCRVPTMGAAFMLLAPMLYTDVSDAWKLRDRRQRMFIDTPVSESSWRSPRLRSSLAVSSPMDRSRARPSCCRRSAC